MRAAAKRERGGLQDGRAVGWHPDSDRVAERYWTGSAWTDWRVRGRGRLTAVFLRVLPRAVVGAVMLLAGVSSLFARKLALSPSLDNLAVVACQVAVGLLVVLALPALLPGVGSVVVTAKAVMIRNLRPRRFSWTHLTDASAYANEDGKWALCLELDDGHVATRIYAHVSAEAVHACASEIRRRLGRDEPPQPDDTVAPPRGRGWYCTSDGVSERYWDGKRFGDFRLRQRRTGAGDTLWLLVFMIVLVGAVIARVKLIGVVTGFAGLLFLWVAFELAREISAVITLTGTGVVISRLLGRTTFAYGDLGGVAVEPNEPAWSIRLELRNGDTVHAKTQLTRAAVQTCASQIRTRMGAQPSNR